MNFIQEINYINLKILFEKLEKGHNGPATVVEVVRDQSSDSVVSAGEDGKVILYSLKEQKMIDSWSEI